MHGELYIIHGCIKNWPSVKVVQLKCLSQTFLIGLYRFSDSNGVQSLHVLLLLIPAILCGVWDDQMMLILQ